MCASTQKRVLPVWTLCALHSTSHIKGKGAQTPLYAVSTYTAALTPGQAPDMKVAQDAD
jgi:hypothetical protein